MKHLLTLLLSGVSVYAAGQPAYTTSHARMLTGLLSRQQRAAASSRTTAVTRERVIAQSTTDYSGIALTDSIALSYTGLHGSTYDYNQMFYPYNYSYSTSPMFNFLGVFTTPKVLYDTWQHWTQNPFTLTYGYYEATSATYSTGNAQLTFRHTYADSVTNRNTSYANDFTTAGKINSGTWFNSLAGTPDSAFRQYFAYNGFGQLTSDSIYERKAGVWHQVSRTYYTYDDPGNLVTIRQFANVTDTTLTLPLVEQLRYDNTYDAGNRLYTVHTSMYNGTSLIPYVKDTFLYTGSGTFHTSWRQYQWDIINAYWAPMIKTDKHLNALNLPDTVYTYSFDSLANMWIPAAKDVITYNTMNDPLKLYNYQYAWTSFPATPDYTTTYYYETYLDATAVPGVIAATNTLRLFPNPAYTDLNMDTRDIPLKGAMISITDVQGRILMRVQGVTTVDVSTLCPGTYYVQVQTLAGQSYTATFTKL